LAQRIGILGGTFNPIHYGHLAAAEEIRTWLALDRVLFIPTNQPPHKDEEDIPSAIQRLEMVRLAVSDNPHFMPSDIEIKRGGRSYTIDTIQALRQAYPGSELYFITGLDSFLDIQTWNQWDTLLGLCRFAVISRPGYRFADLLKIDFLKKAGSEVDKLDRGELTHAVIRSGAFNIYLARVPHYDLSSTDIRRRVKQGGSIKYFLPEPVETYIIKNEVYV
jgi:nicotinate-nucleotide adenylyltransferase